MGKAIVAVTAAVILYYIILCYIVLCYDSGRDGCRPLAPANEVTYNVNVHVE